MPDRPGLDKVLQCTTLPSLPTVCVQVLALTRDPNTSMEQIARVLETDPALSAKVLKTVNSSVYGLKGSCTTIRRALNFLGLSAVKSIVLGFSLVDSTRHCDGADGFDANDHWRRSIFGAAAARSIALRVGNCDPEEVFAAALFQDLGALAMLTALGRQYLRAISRAPKDHARHAAMEKGALGFSHAECGAALATKWRLPDRYVQTILHHHAPDEAGPEYRHLVRVVGLGSQMAAVLTTENASERLAELLAAARLWFNLSPADMTEQLSLVGKAAAELAKLFGKKVGPVPNAATLMQQASEELVNQQIAVMREAEVLREKNASLLAQTMTDPLTGIGSRRRFDAEAERLLAESRAIGRPLALVMCDGDRFKSVNDAHGHHVGDVVLRELAQRIAASVGAAGIVCRFGGEEFTILAPGVTLPQAVALAEAARAAVCSSEFDLSATADAPPKLPITISLGVVCSDAAAGGAFPSVTAFIEQADKALYAAKHAGRNRVMVEKCPPPVPSPVSVPPVAPPPAAAPGPGSGLLISIPGPAQRSPTPGRAPAAHPAAQPAAPRLLLVEDDPLAARMILAIVQRTPGVEVEWLKGVGPSVERIRQGANDRARTIHAVIADLSIVGGTGLDVLRAVREQPGLASIPFVLISAADDPETARRCMDAGAGEFISKENVVQQLPGWIARIIAETSQSRAA
jgi:diguanylate cyclase (GGDEF)-like protein